MKRKTNTIKNSISDKQSLQNAKKVTFKGLGAIILLTFLSQILFAQTNKLDSLLFEAVKANCFELIYNL